MNNLPTEIISKIMLQMNLESLYNFCKTSKHIRNTCKYLLKNKVYKNDLAKAILKNEFGYTNFPDNLNNDYPSILININNILQENDYKSNTFEYNNEYVYEESIMSGDLKLLKFTIANGIIFNIEDIFDKMYEKYEDSLHYNTNYYYCDILLYLFENNLNDYLSSLDDYKLESIVQDMKNKCTEFDDEELFDD
jgi:hypothetical protein